MNQCDQRGERAAGELNKLIKTAMDGILWWHPSSLSLLSQSGHMRIYKKYNPYIYDFVYMLVTRGIDPNLLNGISGISSSRSGANTFFRPNLFLSWNSQDVTMTGFSFKVYLHEQWFLCRSMSHDAVQPDYNWSKLCIAWHRTIQSDTKTTVCVNGHFPGANPKIGSYNASAVKNYNAKSSLVRFENKKILF
jgi:hypothetical protein